MNDDSMQPDDAQSPARPEERPPAPASLPWLDDPPEELFGAPRLRTAPAKPGV